ncbi:MAG: hypothetical protein JWO97_532 [Acidobacteria bacterium]|nr:hypothetical protein [Acidobacteriota bacterium]
MLKGLAQTGPVRYVLAAKWIVASTLLFAMTLPFATCYSKDGLQTQYISWSTSSIPDLLCFFWPLPILIARTFWRRPRTAWKLALADLLLSLVALFQLVMNLVALTVLSFGGVRAGPGFNLAFSCLAGYAALSITDLFAIRKRDIAHTADVAFAE